MARGPESKPQQTASKKSRETLRSAGKSNRSKRPAKKRRHNEKKSTSSTAKGPVNLLRFPTEQLSRRPNQPPPGYVFVKRGNVYVTRHCRLLTRIHRMILYVVVGMDKSQIGLHVPRKIFLQVRKQEKATAAARREAVLTRDTHELEKTKQLISRLYPSIPASSLDKVLSHAYEKGSGRVGRSTTSTAELKAHRAVQAHARHQFTLYDQILRAGRENRQKQLFSERVRKEARDQIDSELKLILRSWKQPAKKALSKLSKQPPKPAEDTEMVLDHPDLNSETDTETEESDFILEDCASSDDGEWSDPESADEDMSEAELYDSD